MKINWLPLMGIIIMAKGYGIQCQFILGDNCIPSKRFEVKCTCTNKELTLSYDTVHISAAVKSVSIENCTDTLTVKDEALLHFQQLEKITFRNILNLEVHTGAIELFGGELEFHDIKSLRLFPGSIAIPGDGVSKVIIVDSVVHLEGQRPSRRNSQGKVVQDATFKCNCQDIYYDRDNPAIVVMKNAMNCSAKDVRVREDNCVRAPSRSISSATSWSGSTSLQSLFFFNVLTIVYLL